MDGTSLVRFKAAYLEALEQRLPHVNVAVPLTDEDVNAEDGSRQVAWFDGEAENVSDVKLMKAMPCWIEESYTVTLVLQALGSDTDDTQDLMEQAATGMLGEAIAVLADDPSLGIATDSDVQMFTALPTAWKFTSGVVPPNLRGARYDLVIEVKARLTLELT